MLENAFEHTNITNISQFERAVFVDNRCFCENVINNTHKTFVFERQIKGDFFYLFTTLDS